MTPLDALKAHLNILDDADDVALGQTLDAATAWVERMTGGPLDPVPAPVAQATRMLAGSLFLNKEGTLVGASAQEVPFGVMDLLEPYRAWY